MPGSEIFRSVCSYLKSLLEDNHPKLEAEECSLSVKEPLTFSVVNKPTVRVKSERSEMFTLSPVEKTATQGTNEVAMDSSELDFNLSNVSLINAKFLATFLLFRALEVFLQKNFPSSKTKL